MRIFDYDKYLKVGSGFDWAKGCKNHRVERGFAISDNGGSKSICRDWESEVPDFMVGDRVVIKTWEQMKTEYGIDEFESIKCKLSFAKGMRSLCGKKATITGKDEKQIWLTFDDKKADNSWNFSIDMIELAYPTVRGCEVKEKVMKEELKVGDRVIATKKVGNKHKKNVYGILKEDDGSYGRRYLVEFDTDIGGNAWGKKCWWCNADEIKKVVIDEVKSTKFKVGDIIIGNDKNKYTYTAKGVKCKVIGFVKDDLAYDIKVRIIGTKEDYPVHSKYFDLVESPKVTYTSNTVEYNGEMATCQMGDKFDLEKGIMLCLLKEKGIGYREIQELAKTAERKINHKFNTGDIVKVINNGAVYSLYEKWFDDNDFLMLKPFFAKDKRIANGKELKVRAYSEGGLPRTMIYACEDLKGNIYLIGERGLEKVED